MTRALLIVIAFLALLAGSLGVYGRRQSLRADAAVQARLLSEQTVAILKAQVQADQTALEEERREREAQDQRLRLAGDAAGKLRREGEARVQRLLMAPAPQDPHELATWAAAQAQDLNRRLEAP